MLRLQPQLKSFSLLIGLLLVTQLACQAIAPKQPQASQKPPATQGVTNQPTTVVETQPTATTGKVTTPTTPANTPTEVSKPGDNGGSGNAGELACFGSTSSGITCLGANGWEIFTSDNSSLPAGSVEDMEACPGGRVAAVSSNGVAIYDGKQWKNYSGKSGMFIGASAVACDEKGFWVSYIQGVTHYDGSNYTDYSADQIAQGASIFEDIALAPDGAVWTITNDTVAKFDGSTWTTYTQGNGFNENFNFQHIIVDANGAPWVMHSRGVVYFDGDVWKENSNSKLSGLNGLAADAQGRLWVASDKGLYMLDKGKWTQFDLQKQAGASNKANAVSVDTQGRVWVGTEYGLAVYDGKTWTAYFMHTAGLADNDVRAASVSQAGPTLPQPLEKEKGSLTARIVDNSQQPIANAPVEICVLTIFMNFEGKTPCSNQPFMVKSQTDSDGSFTVDGLPTGYYVITVYAQGSWWQLVGQFGAFTERVLVDAGESKDVGDIKLNN